MFDVRDERMSAAFLKHHIDLGNGGFVVHRFSEPDRGDPHDHPFRFTSLVVKGSYVEEVFDLDGSSQLVRRRHGDCFQVAARHIHRIVELPDGECATVVLYGPWEQQPGFWRFEEGRALRRVWNEDKFRAVRPPPPEPGQPCVKV